MVHWDMHVPSVDHKILREIDDHRLAVRKVRAVITVKLGGTELRTYLVNVIRLTLVVIVHLRK